jgi:DNA modification methylase
VSAKPGRRRDLWVTDNLSGLARLTSGSVGLAYLDPPFNSKRIYDAIVAEREMGDGHRRRAFADSWNWDDEAEKALGRASDLLPRAVNEFLLGLLGSLGRCGLIAYLVMMATRLNEVHRSLAEHGSLYVHCDPAASHYLKVLLDHIFGPENFRNEIVWKRTHAHSSSRRFGPVHDVILFYSKTQRYTWNPLFSRYASSYVEDYFTHTDERGRYQLITCTAPGDRTGTRAHYEWRGKLPPPGRHWAWTRERMEEFERDGQLFHSSNGVPRLRRYVDDGLGVVLQDLWVDINRLDSHSEERVGFETQKPVALLDRIIAASSTPGDLVLDPFCGSGTTLVAAERAARRWIGMDSSLLACSMALARVRQVVHLSDVGLVGFPESRTEALRVLRDDPVGFGIWGTSMLATLADRKAFNGSVAIGAGSLNAGHKRLQLLSWVPLRNRVEAPLPQIPKGQLSKAGFVLRVGQGHQALREWLRQNVAMKVHDVPLEDLVQKESLKRGVASQILVAARSS